MIYVTQPALTPQYFLFVFCYNQLQHLLPCIFIFIVLPLFPTPHHIPSKDGVIPMKTYVQCSISAREFEVCLNKAGDHT